MFVMEIKVLLHSVDGLTWIETRRPAKIKANSVCYGNGIYVLVGYKSNHITYSIDGVNWFCGSTDTYQLENTIIGMNITAEGCEARHIVVEDSKVKFEDESIIITSTTEVTEGSASTYPERSLYVVYKEG